MGESLRGGLIGLSLTLGVIWRIFFKKMAHRGHFPLNDLFIIL
jgi:hypothetical protein